MRGKSRYVVFTAFFLCLYLTALHSPLRAQDAVNENDMFSSSDSVVETHQNRPAEADKKTVGFSGQLTSAFLESVNRSSTTDNTLNTLIVGNIFLDARLRNLIKGFANVETIYAAQSKTTTFLLRELFFDFSLKDKVYFRTGKQVLQWGTCSFWNPTDFINVEKITFIPKIGYREGAYGVKAHVPFGTKVNLYGFWDTGNAGSLKDTGGALKAEFLLGNTEMSFSGWSKKNNAFGYDMSSRLWTVDIAGEYALIHGDTADRFRLDNGVLSLYRRSDEWFSRACVSLRKFFPLGDFKDRVTVTSEWNYNGSGYDENAFSDDKVYLYARPAGPFGNIISGRKRNFLIDNNIYDIHNYGKAYTALFTSVSRFIISDCTFNLNYITNIKDTSGILSTGVTYKNLSDLSAGFLVNTAVGGTGREYTFADEIYNVQVTVGIAF